MLEAYENRLPGEKLSLLVSLPFISVHIGALFALTISPSPFALFMVFLMYFIRMFGITAGFHRFFSHKTFKTSRAFQFILAYSKHHSADLIGKSVDHLILLNLSSAEPQTNFPSIIKADDEMCVHG